MKKVASHFMEAVGVLYFVFKKIFIDTKLEEHHNGY